jgi:hypothetical protein
VWNIRDDEAAIRTIDCWQLIGYGFLIERIIAESLIDQGRAVRRDPRKVAFSASSVEVAENAV